MATIVNTPAAPQTSDSSGATGLMIGLVLLAIFAFLMFFYGLPALRNTTQQAPSNVNVDIPDKVDVNVNENPGQ
jgi:LPXTG-motif cell wall-anchored protein